MIEPLRISPPTHINVDPYFIKKYIEDNFNEKLRLILKTSALQSAPFISSDGGIAVRQLNDSHSEIKIEINEDGGPSEEEYSKALEFIKSRDIVCKLLVDDL